MGAGGGPPDAGQYDDKETNMKKRCDYIDLLRFLAAIPIIMTHIFNMGIPWGTYPFTYGWVYVEMFFIITGYFSTKHFASVVANDALPAGPDDRMKRALEYTKKKFIRFLPYTTVIILTEYVFANLYLLDGGIKNYLFGFSNTLFEMLYLSPATKHTPLAAPVWYLAAMFLVFPVYACLLQMKSRNWLKWLSFILPVLYYGYFGVSGLREYPHDLMRSAACMMIGTNMYLNQERFNAFYAKCRSRLLLTAVEILCLLFTVVVTYRNIGAFMNLCLIAFIVMLSLFFSGRTYTSSVSWPLSGWLGRLSVPLIFWNWTIATIIRSTAPGLDDGTKYVVYFCGCLVVPLAHFAVVEGLRRRRTARQAVGNG